MTSVWKCEGESATAAATSLSLSLSLSPAFPLPLSPLSSSSFLPSFPVVIRHVVAPPMAGRSAGGAGHGGGGSHRSGG